MYTTSAEYKQNYLSGIIVDKIMGSIICDRVTYPINDEHILDGSLSITNQCTNGDKFCFGSVYAGQMQLTFIRDDLPTESLQNAIIRLNYWVILPSGKVEVIPLGQWQVYEAIWHKKTVALTCYDYMLKLDAELDVDLEGDAYQMISACCNFAGITLGTSQSVISSMPNGSFNLSAKKDDIDTYRSLLSYACAAIGCFATISRTGELKIVPYTNPAVGTIAKDVRVSTSTSDYKVFYGQVKGEFLNEDGEFQKSYVTAYANGLKIDLGKNPLIVGSQAEHMAICGNLMNMIAPLRYKTATIDMLPDPSYDLGDLITISNINDSGENANILLTKYTFTYRKKCEIKSEGADPARQAVTSKTEKDIEQSSKDAAKKAMSLDWIITEVNKISTSQFTVTAEKESEKVTNTWNVSESGGVTIFRNVTAGYDIEFKGW